MIRSYIDLVESARNATVASTSPGFSEWFANSKVTLPNGSPATVFHGTAATFRAFRPMSHFGTEGAAQDRLRHLDATGEIIGVHLSIKNPLQFQDNGWDHNIEAVLNDLGYSLQLYDNGISDEDEIGRKLTALRMKRVRSWKPIIDFIASEGFDGLQYVNRVEAAGSLSYTVFSPKQVWRISSNRPDR